MITKVQPSFCTIWTTFLLSDLDQICFLLIGLAYINDAPVYGESGKEYVEDYYDKIISCSSYVPEEHKEYINYQMHRHSKACCVGKLKCCRFSFPPPPMSYTCILEPFLSEDIEKESEGKQS